MTPHYSSDHIRAVVQRRPLNRGSLGLSSGYEPSSSLVAAEDWNPSDIQEVQYRRVSPDIGLNSARFGTSLEARPAIAVRQDEVRKLSQNSLSTPQPPLLLRRPPEADWGEIRELGAPRQENVPAHFLSWLIHRAPADTLRLPAGKCPARLLGQALQANFPTPRETLSRASASASQVVSPIDGGGRILDKLLLR